MPPTSPAPTSPKLTLKLSLKRVIIAPSLSVGGCAVGILLAGSEESGLGRVVGKINETRRYRCLNRTYERAGNVSKKIKIEFRVAYHVTTSVVAAISASSRFRRRWQGNKSRRPTFCPQHSSHLHTTIFGIPSIPFLVEGFQLISRKYPFRLVLESSKGVASVSQEREKNGHQIRPSLPLPQDHDIEASRLKMSLLRRVNISARGKLFLLSSPFLVPTLDESPDPI